MKKLYVFATAILVFLLFGCSFSSSGETEISINMSSVIDRLSVLYAEDDSDTSSAAEEEKFTVAFWVSRTQLNIEDLLTEDFYAELLNGDTPDIEPQSDENGAEESTDNLDESEKTVKEKTAVLKDESSSQSENPSAPQTDSDSAPLQSDTKNETKPAVIKSGTLEYLKTQRFRLPPQAPGSQIHLYGVIVKDSEVLYTTQKESVHVNFGKTSVNLTFKKYGSSGDDNTGEDNVSTVLDEVPSTVSFEYNFVTWTTDGVEHTAERFQSPKFKIEIPQNAKTVIFTLKGIPDKDANINGIEIFPVEWTGWRAEYWGFFPEIRKGEEYTATVAVPIKDTPPKGDLYVLICQSFGKDSAKDDGVTFTDFSLTYEVKEAFSVLSYQETVNSSLYSFSYVENTVTSLTKGEQAVITLKGKSDTNFKVNYVQISGFGLIGGVNGHDALIKKDEEFEYTFITSKLTQDGGWSDVASLWMETSINNESDNSNAPKYAIIENFSMEVTFLAEDVLPFNNGDSALIPILEDFSKGDTIKVEISGIPDTDAYLNVIHLDAWSNSAQFYQSLNYMLLDNIVDENGFPLTKQKKFSETFYIYVPADYLPDSEVRLIFRATEQRFNIENFAINIEVIPQTKIVMLRKFLYDSSNGIYSYSEDISLENPQAGDYVTFTISGVPSKSARLTTADISGDGFILESNESFYDENYELKYELKKNEKFSYTFSGFLENFSYKDWKMRIAISGEYDGDDDDGEIFFISDFKLSFEKTAGEQQYTEIQTGDNISFNGHYDGKYYSNLIPINELLEKDSTLELNFSAKIKKSMAVQNYYVYDKTDTTKEAIGFWGIGFSMQNNEGEISDTQNWSVDILIEKTPVGNAYLVLELGYTHTGESPTGEEELIDFKMDSTIYQNQAVLQRNSATQQLYNETSVQGYTLSYTSLDFSQYQEGDTLYITIEGNPDNSIMLLPAVWFGNTTAVLDYPNSTDALAIMKYTFTSGQTATKTYELHLKSAEYYSQTPIFQLFAVPVSYGSESPEKICIENYSLSMSIEKL